MHNYRLSEEADQDITGILDYTFTNFGESQAEKYYSSLKTYFEFLADNPRAETEVGLILMISFAPILINTTLSFTKSLATMF